MTAAGNARSTALSVLRAMDRSGAWADAALKAQLRRDSLSPQDAALATRLVYGVQQNRMLLDFWIAVYCSQKPDHLQVPLLDILRLGVYQIVFLDKIPDSAAVNESVKLTKLSGRAQASGLVNAVLRKIVQNKENLPKPDSRNPVQCLSLTYSHPRWLVKRLVTLLGAEEAERFLKRFLAPYVKSDAERTLADAVSAAAAPTARPAPAASAVRRFCGCRKRAGLSLLPRHRPRHRRYCSSCMPSSEPRGIATVREARRDSALA